MSSDKALDHRFLDELLDGDREFAWELFLAFREASSGWLDKARAACSEGHSVQAAQAFHTLKGSAGSVGLGPLRELAMECEGLAKEGQLSDCLARFQDLEAAAEEGRDLLAAYLDGMA